MKKRLKGLGVLALCTVLLCLLALPASGATVCFLAVNNTLLPLEDGSMPSIINGTYYVPYTALSVQETGVDLGVYAAYSPVRRQLQVYSGSSRLTFDLQGGTTYDGEGRSYVERAVTRNSTVYIPIALVCELFPTIDYSHNDTRYGTLIRIRSSSVTLGDAAFIDAASSMMKNALSRYEAAHPSPSPSPSSSVPPTPSQKPEGSGGAVYPAFLLDSGDGLDAILTAVEGEGIRCLVFFPAELAESRGDLIRQTLGRGHFVGIALGEDPEGDLARGREAVARSAFSRVTAVLPGGEAVPGEEAGVVCWTSTVDCRTLEGSTQNLAKNLLRSLTGGEDARNRLLFDEDSLWLLPTVFAALDREEYQLRTPVPAELGGKE